MGILRRVALTAVLLAALPAVALAGQVSFADKFSGPSLDPAWQVSLDRWTSGWEASGWSYGFSGDALHVTEISPGSTPDHWYFARLERDLANAGDLSIALDMEWRSILGTSDVKDLFFTLYAADGSIVGRIAYHDAWSQQSAEWVARVDTANPQYDDYWTGYNSLSHSGRETLRFERTDGQMSFQIGGSEVLSVYSPAAVTKLGIEFGYFDGPNATFDRLTVHDLRGTYSVVPLPAAGWLGIVLLGVLAVTRQGGPGRVHRRARARSGP